MPWHIYSTYVHKYSYVSLIAISKRQSGRLINRATAAKSEGAIQSAVEAANEIC